MNLPKCVCKIRGRHRWRRKQWESGWGQYVVCKTCGKSDWIWPTSFKVKQYINEVINEETNK